MRCGAFARREACVAALLFVVGTVGVLATECPRWPCSGTNVTTCANSNRTLTHTHIGSTYDTHSDSDFVSVSVYEAAPLYDYGYSDSIWRVRIDAVSSAGLLVGVSVSTDAFRDLYAYSQNGSLVAYYDTLRNASSVPISAPSANASTAPFGMNDTVSIFVNQSELVFKRDGIDVGEWIAFGSEEPFENEGGDVALFVGFFGDGSVTIVCDDDIDISTNVPSSNISATMAPFSNYTDFNPTIHNTSTPTTPPTGSTDFNPTNSNISATTAPFTNSTDFNPTNHNTSTPTTPATNFTVLLPPRTPGTSSSTSRPESALPANSSSSNVPWIVLGVLAGVLIPCGAFLIARHSSMRKRWAEIISSDSEKKKGAANIDTAAAIGASAAAAAGGSGAKISSEVDLVNPDALLDEGEDALLDEGEEALDREASFCGRVSRTLRASPVSNSSSRTSSSPSRTSSSSSSETSTRTCESPRDAREAFGRPFASDGVGQQHVAMERETRRDSLEGIGAARRDKWKPKRRSLGVSSRKAAAASAGDIDESANAQEGERHGVSLGDVDTHFASDTSTSEDESVVEETIHTGGAKPQTCKKCRKVFHGVRQLKHHMKRDHGEVKTYGCPECAKVFPRKFNMEQHLKNVHKGARDYKCDFCDETFTQRTNMKRHIASKHSQPFRCLETACTASFSSSGDLKAHIGKAHTKVTIATVVAANDIDALNKRKRKVSSDVKPGPGSAPSVTDRTKKTQSKTQKTRNVSSAKTPRPDVSPRSSASARHTSERNPATSADQVPPPPYTEDPVHDPSGFEASPPQKTADLETARRRLEEAQLAYQLASQGQLMPPLASRQQVPPLASQGQLLLPMASQGQQVPPRTSQGQQLPLTSHGQQVPPLAPHGQLLPPRTSQEQLLPPLASQGQLLLPPLASQEQLLLPLASQGQLLPPGATGRPTDEEALPPSLELLREAQQPQIALAALPFIPSHETHSDALLADGASFHASGPNPTLPEGTPPDSSSSNSTLPDGAFLGTSAPNSLLDDGASFSTCAPNSSMDMAPPVYEDADLSSLSTSPVGRFEDQSLTRSNILESNFDNTLPVRIGNSHLSSDPVYFDGEMRPTSGMLSSVHSMNTFDSQSQIGQLAGSHAYSAHLPRAINDTRHRTDAHHHASSNPQLMLADAENLTSVHPFASNSTSLSVYSQHSRSSSVQPMTGIDFPASSNLTGSVRSPKTPEPVATSTSGKFASAHLSQALPVQREMSHGAPGGRQEATSSSVPGGSTIPVFKKHFQELLAKFPDAAKELGLDESLVLSQVQANVGQQSSMRTTSGTMVPQALSNMSHSQGQALPNVSAFSTAPQLLSNASVSRLSTQISHHGIVSSSHRQLLPSLSTPHAQALEGDDSPRIGRVPQGDDSPRIGLVPQVPQSDDSSRIGHVPQSDDSPRIGLGPQVLQSDDSSRIGLVPQVPQRDDSSRIGHVPQGSDSPRIGRVPQSPRRTDDFEVPNLLRSRSSAHERRHSLSLSYSRVSGTSANSDSFILKPTSMGNDEHASVMLGEAEPLSVFA